MSTASTVCPICGGEHSSASALLVGLQPWRPCMEVLAARIAALAPPSPSPGVAPEPHIAPYCCMTCGGMLVRNGDGPAYCPNLKCSPEAARGERCPDCKGSGWLDEHGRPSDDLGLDAERCPECAPEAARGERCPPEGWTTCPCACHEDPTARCWCGAGRAPSSSGRGT